MPEGKPKVVLVVDDDPDILSLVAFVLEAEGYEVSTAIDGRKGMETVELDMPDLILLDMKMPVMNGWEFAQEFREKHDHEAPIVVLTAAEDARRRAEEVGALGWVGKPFDLDTLVAAVDRWVRK